MAARSDTRLLGLRGLHAESLRQGDQDEAHRIAVQSQGIAPLAWSGQAVLDRHAAQADWDAARLCVTQNLRAKVMDAATGKRQKAVIDTAQAMDCELTDPQRAIGLLRAAVKKAPDLIPATALLGRLLSRKGDMRAGVQADRNGLRRLAPSRSRPGLYRHAARRFRRRPAGAGEDPGQSRARPSRERDAGRQAALGARDFAAAREAMSPLIYGGESPPPACA